MPEYSKNWGSRVAYELLTEYVATGEAYKEIIVINGKKYDIYVIELSCDLDGKLYDLNLFNYIFPYIYVDSPLRRATRENVTIHTKFILSEIRLDEFILKDIS